MNYNVLGVVLFVAGTVLMYSGVTNRNPKDVVTYGMKGKTAPNAHGITTDPETGRRSGGGTFGGAADDDPRPTDGTQVVSV